MRKLIVLLASAVVSVEAYTQTKDSLINQTGFIFLSAYNFLYDTTRSGDLILIPTFSDFFFPENGDVNKLIKKNKDTLSFKKGVRLYFFEGREELLKQAKEYHCIVDSTLCYPFDKFYILPVKIQYELTKYNDRLVCSEYYYDLKLKRKRTLHFSILGKTVYLKNIVPYKK